MKQYRYDGPVMLFDKCIVSRWKASTFAVSEAKARSNLTYQYKSNNCLLPNTKVTLPGKLITV